MYVRFVLPETTATSGRRRGLFSAAYALQKEIGHDDPDAQSLADALAWLDANLPLPDRFNRSASKGAYRRETAGLSWLKSSAEEAIARMWVLKAILERRGHNVSMITTSRPGYIVHEDALQIVAEPFADTER